MTVPITTLEGLLTATSGQYITFAGDLWTFTEEGEGLDQNGESYTQYIPRVLAMGFTEEYAHESARAYLVGAHLTKID